MDANKRREEIITIIRGQSRPVSATTLAQTLGVSRQIIVGDIALLRATGHDIIATARGYIFPDRLQTGRYVGKIACQHTNEMAARELHTIVELGGQVVDVIVEHELYGELTGQLNLSARSDVEAFVKKREEFGARLLSELTQGLHLHTVACEDADTFQRIRAALQEQGLLYQND